MAKRRRYTDKFRADAIALLEGAGYPDREGALADTARHIGVPAQTLHRWARGKNNPPPPELVIEKKGDLADELESIVWLMTGHLKNEDTIGDMTGQQTATSIGILIDKIRLLRGLPTEVIAIIPEVVQAIERAGDNPQDVFRRLIERANARADNR